VAPVLSVGACDSFLFSQLVVSPSGCDQFRVSPDGQWIAVIAGQGSSQTLYVVNVSTPSSVSQIVPAGALYVTSPRFSADSKTIYFLATSLPSGANKTLYLAALSTPGTTAQVSATSAPGGSDDVSDYAVSQDQTRILLQAKRGGADGLYFVDATHLQTELLINQVGQTVVASTISLPPGNGGSPTNARVAYTDFLTANVYVAEVSAVPNPRLAAASGHVIGLRPDDGAVLYWSSTNVFEATIDSGSPQLVGGGGNGWYDSTGNIVLLHQSLPSGPALASTYRGSFGSTQPVGTPGMAANYTNASGFDRAVALIGEGPGPTPPASVHLALVNALAPSNLFYLAAFQTPLGLTSDVARIVTQ
ncbi:MAG TPA: hypothetical protein VJQ47_11810, partial [Steroidobacteraceae bacterium]|nr:hypothetical protein [Steroidobacteraceae bacterium]